METTLEELFSIIVTEKLEPWKEFLTIPPCIHKLVAFNEFLEKSTIKSNFGFTVDDNTLRLNPAMQKTEIEELNANEKSGLVHYYHSSEVCMLMEIIKIS